MQAADSKDIEHDLHYAPRDSLLWMHNYEICFVTLQGLDVLAPTLHAGNLARPRMFEIGAAVNRLRSLKMRQQR